MRIDRSVIQKMDTSSGVSEVVGAIMLVSIVALLVAVVGVYLFSQPVPQKIPNLNFMTGTNSDKSSLYLYHNGGDTLTVGEFKVLLDGKETSYSVSGGGNQWSLGKNLVVPITPSTMPQSIQLVYNNSASSGGPGSTGSVLLDQASVNVVSSVTASPDQLPYLDCSAVRNWDCRFQIPSEIIIDRYMANTTSRKINFMQFGQDRGAVAGGTNHHFNFTVTKDNSSIVLGNDQCTATTIYKLNTNDKVRINMASAQAPDWFTVYGMAPQIWEIVAGGSSRMTITIINTSGTYTFAGTKSICHAYVEQYSNLDSTLDITTTTTGAMTALIVNDTKYIQAPSSTVYTLINFQPISNGMFMVTYGGNQAPIYVIGWADAIQYGGVNQTGLGL